ncbi:MAG: Fe-S protein assembly co-chaperone HscB [Alphaproteobacteria bacterium]|nr:Fe-S protein assembly co-chaperone HscB [Alphaproteobacteria bacterium]NCQ66460.1 Fe-S protein assembly co-chaperone HscB [Alphaproteobacteria bacterium]
MFKDKNHFALFGLTPSFRIAPDDLDPIYRKLNQQFHPDRMTRGNSREKLEATLATAQINEAYETLKNPLKRGHYLLKCLDSDTDVPQEKTIKDADLLLEALEQQEALSLAKTTQDIEPLLKQAQDKKSRTLLTIEKAFDEKDFSQARLNLYRYRYYEKLVNDATAQLNKISEKLKDHASTA